MKIKLANAMRNIALGGALAAVATSGFAVTQGNLGFTSTGDVDIFLTVNDEVRINNLADIPLSFSGADVTGSSDACVYRNGGTTYEITATGDGALNAFTLTNGVDTVAYSVSYNDGTTTTAMGTGTAVPADNAETTDDNCAGVGGSNATISVTVTAANAASLPQDTYAGTLTLLVAPI